MAGKVGCWCCRLRGGLSAGVWWAKGGWLLGGSWRGWVVAAGEAAAAARCVVGVCVVVQLVPMSVTRPPGSSVGLARPPEEVCRGEGAVFAAGCSVGVSVVSCVRLPRGAG